MAKKSVKVHDLEFDLFISEAQIQQRIHEIGAELTQKYVGKKPLFLGVLNGSFLFAADLVRACDMECEISFVKVSSYAGLHSTGEVRTLLGLETNISGRPLIIVEDIVDSGKTMYELLPGIRKKSPASVEIVSLFMKPEALEYPLDVAYVGFSIPNKFIVGYGLDYDGLGRNLSDVYRLRES